MNSTPTPTMSVGKLKDEIYNAIQTNYIYMSFFVSIAIGLLVIFSLLLALTDQAKACVTDKDLTNSGYVAGGIGLIISIILMICAIYSSKNMRSLGERIRNVKFKR
jgi:Na+-driven multidrug efflux pump